MPTERPTERPTDRPAESAIFRASARFSGSGLACLRGGRMVFSGLDFHLGAGGVLVLTGPNGIGKSSLLRVMAGLLPPTAGTLELDAPDEEDSAPGTGALAPRAAYLGHADALKAQMTVAEEITFATRLGGPHDARGRDAAVREAIDAFVLGPLGHVACRYLSAGQKRRVALGRVVAMRAGLWLLDEPTTALDAAGIDAFTRALAAHRARGGMAVIATHHDITADGAETLEMARFAGGALSDPFYRGLALDEEV